MGGYPQPRYGPGRYNNNNSRGHWRGRGFGRGRWRGHGSDQLDGSSNNSNHEPLGSRDPGPTRSAPPPENPSWSSVVGRGLANVTAGRGSPMIGRGSPVAGRGCPSRGRGYGILDVIPTSKPGTSGATKKSKKNAKKGNNDHLSQAS